MRRRDMIIGAGAALLASPALASEYRQVFKRPAADVYAALVRALPSLGYKIRSQNDELMRVSLSAGMSAFSLGENLTVGVTEEGDARSAIEVDGELKMSSNILAKGRVMKHFDRIVNAVSEQLTKPTLP